MRLVILIIIFGVVFIILIPPSTTDDTDDHFNSSKEDKDIDKKFTLFLHQSLAEAKKAQLVNRNVDQTFYPMVDPVTWSENQRPGVITTLKGRRKNGKNYEFSLHPLADEIIKSYFGVSTAVDGSGIIKALGIFDREKQKIFFIPILISLNGRPVQTIIQCINIGDQNDNIMRTGHIEITVFVHKGIEGKYICRVPVIDYDDWDLPDKTFNWKDGIPHPSFDLDPETGDISFKEIPSIGTYPLHFTVSEMSADHFFWNHTVEATVNVTVKQDPKSGSQSLMSITEPQVVKAPPAQVRNLEKHDSSNNAVSGSNHNMMCSNTYDCLVLITAFLTILQLQYNIVWYIYEFLDCNKRQVDNNPDSEPFVNSYVDDKNSIGSLSFLASGTDEGDLYFDCLSDFGPEFKRLANMYGEYSSDEIEENLEPGGASNPWRAKVAIQVPSERLIGMASTI